MNDPVRHDSVPDISWWRAFAVGLFVLVAGFAGVSGASRILTNALGVTRGGREALAVGVFVVVITVLATLLRWLQRRGAI